MSETTLRTFPKIGWPVARQPRLLPLFAFIAIVMAVSLFFVWSRLQVVNLEYDISRLGAEQRQLQQEIRQLQLEAASLRHPGRIERVARKELGLRAPVPEQMVAVR